MNMNIDVFMVVTLVLSLVTAIVGACYKKSKKELTVFGLDVILTYISFLLGVGMIGTLFQIFVQQIKFILGLKDIAEIAENEPKKLKVSLVLLIITGIVLDIVSLYFFGQQRIHS